MTKCNICQRLRARVKSLKADRAFFAQESEPDVDDLWTKYWDSDEGKWRMYIEDMKICPNCKGYEVGYRHTDFDGKKHFHLCNCGWKSGVFDGRAF